ncbi:MAG: hypothetical protein JXB29_09870 [Sedimentisphaerales bacterium]|nr:hypothetical protein [Sedimentisphaerales bacterium]
MTEKNIEKLLGRLGQITAEPVRPGLAEDIKDQIPHTLASHRRGMDTINILIDLRISRLAAAAAIIITVVLWAAFLNRDDRGGRGLYQDSKLLIKYCIGGANASKSGEWANMTNFHKYLLTQGIQAYYYGECINPADNNAVLIQWKLLDGNYRVIFAGDLEEKTITAQELVELQSNMLQSMAR